MFFCHLKICSHLIGQYWSRDPLLAGLIGLNINIFMLLAATQPGAAICLCVSVGQCVASGAVRQITQVYINEVVSVCRLNSLLGKGVEHYVNE